MSTPLLLLWDIDGTLLQRASKAHALALHQAVSVVHGVDVSGVKDVAAAGRTDGAIARDLLRAVGVEDAAIDAGFADVARVCAERYDPPDLSGHLVDGIADLLGSLTDGYRHALVTGNYEAIAHTKLGAAGIGRFFEQGQGGFGSDAEERAHLPPVARARAGGVWPPAEVADLDPPDDAAAVAAGEVEGSWPRDRTVVIGDTPNDIACARADSLRVIAVTTGPYEADDLTDADHVVAGPAQLGPLLRDLA